MSTNREVFFENSEEDNFCYHLLTDKIAFDDDGCEFVTAASTAVALAALSSPAPVNIQQSVQEKNKSKSTDAKTPEQTSSTFSTSTSASINFGFAASHLQETTKSADREEVISESKSICEV